MFLSIRFGFVSFGKEEDVKNVLSQGSIFFWGKKINVGPAVKKKVRNICFHYSCSNVKYLHVIIAYLTQQSPIRRG